MNKLRQTGSTQNKIFNQIRNTVFGECGKHPGNNMVNCSQCQIENYKVSIEIDKLSNVMEKLNGFNNGRDTTDGVGGNSPYFFDSLGGKHPGNMFELINPTLTLEELRERIEKHFKDRMPEADQYKTEEVGHLVHITSPGMTFWMNKEAYYKIVREEVKKYLDEEEETNV